MVQLQVIVDSRQACYRQGRAQNRQVMGMGRVKLWNGYTLVTFVRVKSKRGRSKVPWMNQTQREPKSIVFCARLLGGG